MSKLTRNKIFAVLGILSRLFITIGFIYSHVFLIFGLTVVILSCVAYHDSVQTKHSLLRNYPLIGRIRWIFEDERTKILWSWVLVTAFRVTLFHFSFD